MKRKYSTSIVLALALAFCLCSGEAFAQAGQASILHNGTVLPVGAPQWSVYVLQGGTPTIYICNNSPTCTLSGQWVTSAAGAGCAACATQALSNLSSVAVNTTIFSATGVVMTISGFAGTAGLSPTNAGILGGNAFTATSQTPGSVLIAPGNPAAVGATPGNIKLTGANGFGTTGLGSNIYFQSGAGGSTTPLGAGLISFAGGGATAVASETSPLTGTYVPSLYFLAGSGTSGGEIDFVGGGSSNGVIRVTAMPFAFYADNTYDFDLSAYRPKNVYVGTGFYLASTTIGYTGNTSAITGKLMAAGTVAGSSSLLCTDASGNLTITTSSCPAVATTATLVSGNYTKASGAAGIQDSTVVAGPYPGTTLPWETVAECTSTALSTITSANKGYIFGLTLQFPESTSKLEYDVLTADNTANQYDVAIYQGAPSGTENRLLHIGSSSSTGQPGTTFAPATGWRSLNWFEGTTTLQPGRYYLMLTSSCTVGGTSCAQVQADSNSIMFYWPGSGGVSIVAGGASPATYSSSADSPNSSTVPCFFIE